MLDLVDSLVEYKNSCSQISMRRFLWRDAWIEIIQDLQLVRIFASTFASSTRTEGPVPGVCVCTSSAPKVVPGAGW